jgi:predicted RNA-binding protein with PIN domain
VRKNEFHVFADGYNILHSWPAYGVYLEENLEVARNALIEQMAEYRSLSRNRITLVFDAHKVKGQPQRTEHYKGVEIIYTKPLETADLYIERQLRDKPANYRVIVVSNDSMIQQIILGRGGIRTTVQEFMTTLEDHKNLLRRSAKRRETVKTTYLVSMEDLLDDLEQS